eukprot:6647307-Pyramimonas_sp.AAC.1
MPQDHQKTTRDEKLVLGGAGALYGATHRAKGTPNWGCTPNWGWSRMRALPLGPSVELPLGSRNV